MTGDNMNLLAGPNRNLKRHYPGLGERLRALRGSEPQQNIAVRAGTSTGVIVEAERRDTASPLTIVKLARALGVVENKLIDWPNGPETTGPVIGSPDQK